MLFQNGQSKEFSNPLDPCIILGQIFELLSAVGSVSQMNKIGKICVKQFLPAWSKAFV